MRRPMAFFVLAAALLWGLPACAEEPEAVAVIHPTEGNRCKGWVRFTQTGQGVQISARIEGLTPNARHGFHIHEFGDATAADGTSAGGHYNPAGHPHGLPENPTRHAGDLGNLEADASGNAAYESTSDNFSLDEIIGRGVIVHAQPDDGGQPTGNAGGRIGLGVIGLAQPGE